MEELTQWYNQISSFSKLKITAAQDLYRKAINTQDELLRKKYMNELILGTLYVVYEYIKRNGLELFVSSSYDMNDIISSFNEVWIKKIYNGDLLNVDKYSLLFTPSYFNEVCANLSGDEIIVNEQFNISIDCFAELLSLYILFKNKSLTKSFEQVIKEHYYDTNRWAYYTYDKVFNMIPLLERIYDNLNFDKMDDLNLGKTKIANYLKLIINIGLIEPISNEFPDKNDMEDNITTDVVMEYFIANVDEALPNQKEREVIHERFGLDNGNPQLLETIAKNKGITRERVRQIEARALRKLRIREKIRKISNDI